MYVNDLPRYEILSEEAMAVLDKGWRRIVSELGVEFMLPEAVEYFREAGQKVEGEKVFLDPEFLLEQVAKAPREFELQARNPEHSLHIGGNHMAFSAVYGPPFVRDGDVRRDATMADFENFVRLSQVFPSSTRRAARSSSPTTGRSTRATSTWSTRSRPSPTSRTWARSSRPRTRATRSRWGRSCSAGPRHCGAPRVHLVDQLQLAAALGRPHAQRDARVQPHPPGGGGHAVPAHGRDVAGVDPGHARPADGRGAVGHRPHAARCAGLPRGVRLLSLEHRHEIRLPELRHARVGDRPALHRTDRSQLRPALAQRRRSQREPDRPTRRRPTRRS